MSSRRLSVVSVLLFAAAVSLAGCLVGPDYRPVDPPMPARWSSPATTQGSVIIQQPMEVERWWTTFNDATLNSLVQRAVASNLGLEAATERLREARAALGVVRSGLFPIVDASGSFTRSDTGRSAPKNLWRAGLDASWEIDVFGGVRRSVEAAGARLQASVEDRRDVLVSLLGEVATDYFFLRGYQQELFIANENLTVQVRNVNLTHEKKRLGTGTDLDIAQADAQVASTRAQIAGLEALRQQTIYALSVLLGLEPTALNDELASKQEIPQPPPAVPVGLPSDLLRRRPDIRRAEREVAAATADIGVATAELFPRFTLDGAAGIEAGQFSGLGNWGNRTGSFGPGVSWPVFEAGRIRANIEVQNALQAQALTAYRQTVLSALQEVQNALVAYTTEQQRRIALTQAVEANQRAVALATRRYSQGLTDFLSVLDAERSLFASQDALVQSNRTVSANAVALYKALGGGWAIGEEAAATRPASPQSSH